MASPAFIAACCLGNDTVVINGDESLDTVVFEEKVVSVVSLIFAITSSVGIVIVLCPWQHREHGSSTWRPKLKLQNPGLSHVMTCIIVSGILANIGVVVRASARISDFYPPPYDAKYGDIKHVFCIFSSVWVQYFFLCVIFWHLVYGLESYMVSRGQSSSRCIQHVLGWVVPAALCSLATWVAYQQTNKGCGARNDVNLGMLYLIMLAPVVVVLILLLCLFYKSTAAVKMSLIHQRGTYSTSERKIVNQVQIKFILIIIAFTVCWIPNILNGIFVNAMKERSWDLILVFHVLESVLNPFQVLIDTLVLYGWPSSFCSRLSRRRGHGYDGYVGYEDIPRGNINIFHRSWGSETDPLLSFSNNRALPTNTM